ncbi:isochorismatase [Nodosilinea sp. LEGE 07088]|uniref:isochorismatase n=1 Tax=Nodosilinea sp. LEGE 07088 TaxID=2777968 RepID=UPI0018804CE5|nr:isochorismatase [Nodosilinea sp. LEGE 07088]MBE9138650.1 isochorismatase [Nodosilinea sp. LEGE 07088]
MTLPAVLPVPQFFDPNRVGEVWRVPYQQRAAEAKAWALDHRLTPASTDRQRLCLLLIDVQNTFCIPDFELFVGGRSGQGAVEDNRRLAEFIYRNLGRITTITATLDTHTVMQVFHAEFWVDAEGHNPPPMTLIHYDEVVQGKWRVNPAVALNLSPSRDLQAYGLHYTKTLDNRGKYPLTIWPYHSMLGGIGHALVPAIEEACFFHTLARQSQTRFEVKGSHPLTENYSVLSPEVTEDDQGRAIAPKNTPLIQTLLEFDAVIVAGQAKSHCVAWTVADLLSDIQATDPALAQKVYLLDDCTSPVVVPGVVDFTDPAEATYAQFATAGMHRVQSTTPLVEWPGLG